MSLRVHADGLRKKDPGGGAAAATRPSDSILPPPSSPSATSTPTADLEDAAILAVRHPRSGEVTTTPTKRGVTSLPATPGTPVKQFHPVIYSSRPEQRVLAGSTSGASFHRMGRPLIRSNTGGVIPPPPYWADGLVSSSPTVTTPGDGVGSTQQAATSVVAKIAAGNRTPTSMPTTVRPPSSGNTTQTDSTTADDDPGLMTKSCDSDTGAGTGGGGGSSSQPIPGIPYVTSSAGMDAEFNTPRRWAPVNDGDDERMLLNVGGVRHETHVSTLRAIPNSRLSRLAQMHVQSGGGPQEYFFDRHPSVFNAIIDFYRTGELHVPLEVCGAVVKRELDFWQIDEMEIKACCWRHYRSYIENQAILDSFNNSLLKENVHVDLDNLKGWERFQWQVWLILEYPRTSRMAMIYGVTSFLFVVTSIAGFCLETLPGLRPIVTNVSSGFCDQEVSDTPGDGKQQLAQVMTSQWALYVLDVICTVFFSLELMLRFVFAPHKLKFVFSLMNVIDLLALVPLYVTVIFQNSDLQACYLNERFVIEIMFILRIIRMFRIFHLVKHYQALKVLVYALKASLQELLMLFIFLLIGMLVFSTMIYYAERKDATNPGDKFSTIPMGFWWSIITMTTVGYGDVYPTSTIGYIVGTACSVCGVLMVALTIPVISNNFTLFYRHVRSRSIIPRSKGGEADSEIYLPEHTKTARKVSLASNDGGPILNGHVSRMSHMCMPLPSRFTQANSMTNIVMPKSDSDFNLVRCRSLHKAHSDDGVTYNAEAFV